MSAEKLSIYSILFSISCFIILTMLPLLTITSVIGIIIGMQLLILLPVAATIFSVAAIIKSVKNGASTRTLVLVAFSVLLLLLPLYILLTFFTPIF